MGAADWSAQAADLLNAFHRVSIGAGFLVFVVLIFYRWDDLKTLSRAAFHVLFGSLGAVAIPEAVFPLYWFVIKGRPLTDLPADSLRTYAYIGAVLTLLASIVALRVAFTKTKRRAGR